MQTLLYLSIKRREKVCMGLTKKTYIRARSNEDVHIYARNVQMTQPIYALSKMLCGFEFILLTEKPILLIEDGNFVPFKRLPSNQAKEIRRFALWYIFRKREKTDTTDQMMTYTCNAWIWHTLDRDMTPR
jgi:hypothetical protein